MVSAYLGFALVAAAGVEYLVRLAVRRAPYSTVPHDVAVGAGAAIAIVSVALSGEALWTSFGAGTLALTWFGLTRKLLHIPARAIALELGGTLPDFHVQTSAGAGFSCADLVASAPAILVLYRGKW